MKRDAHRKLLTLLCLAMGSTLVLLAGCGALLPEQKAHALFESQEQVAEAFDQIVPGMTRADDLPHLGFDTAKVDILSSRDIEQRFGSADPAVRSCIRAEIYCTGYVFHPAAASDLFQRARHGGTADVTLLVMNGRVIHKVFSGAI
jgi:hypothetical protein